MSYEYSIKLDDSVYDADRVMSELKQSQVISYEKENCVALKDPNSLNTWAYDLRMFKVDKNELLLEVTNTTHDLYALIRSVLPPNYSLTEVEDEDELSLEQVFRLS